MIENWKQKYYIILTGTGISALTSAILQMAMVWYLTEFTRSAMVLSLATMVGIIPRIIFGPFIGVYLDRLNRKKIVIYTDIAIMLLSLLLLTGGAQGQVPIPIILFVMFTRSIGNSIYQPAFQAITPSIVPSDQLGRYAGITQGVESFSLLLSPGLAAFLFGFFNVSQLVWLDVIGVIIGVLSIAFVAIPNNNINSGSVSKANIWQETKEGLQVIKDVPGLLSVMVISALYAIIYAPIGTLFPHIVINYFNAHFTWSGIVEMVFSVGMLLGSFILATFAYKYRKDRAISFSIGLYGLGLVITGLLAPGQVLYFAIVSFFMGISLPFYRGVRAALIQEKVEDRYLGRTFSLVNSLQSLAMPVGLLFSGLFVDRIGVNIFFLICGIACLIITFVSQSMPSFREFGK